MGRIHLLVLAIFVCLAPMLRADEALAPSVLKELKATTVFIKVDAGMLKMSGSGFLTRLSAGAGYIVTNNHVIDPSVPHVIENTPHHKRTISSSNKPAISVVFFSGTPDELSLPAEVVAADKERDLAILLVKGVNRQIKPIDLNAPAELAETTPVFVFGFPFGEALSVEGHNPAITVGRGAISSIRLNDKREVVSVQIDGALNPGNSGGPVVDAKGRLAGVAVATIVGSGIGIAIPASMVKQELAGRVGIAHVVAARAANGKDLFSARVTVPVIDPMGQIQSVTLYWVAASAAKALKPESHLGESPAAHKLLLKVEGGEASGAFDVPAAKDGQAEIVYEVSCATGGSLSYSARSAVTNLGQELAATPSPATPAPSAPSTRPAPDVFAPVAPPVAVSPPGPLPAGGAEYIDAALTSLASEDGHVQVAGADQLRIAPLDESHRGAVLAALTPHLDSADLGLRMACVQAYAHWATVKEAHVLEIVAETPQEHAEMGSAPRAWACAVVGLVRLDPAAARRACDQRKSDFFFCDSTSGALLKLAETEPRYAGIAMGLLRGFDAFHPVIKTSIAEAIEMLKSDAGSVRANGCDVLMIAPIDPLQRKTVLALLAAHLDSTDERARYNYVRAYVHWADAENLKDLQAIADFPKAVPPNEHRQSWTAAVMAMVRLRALEAVIDTYNERADNFAFQDSFIAASREMSEGIGPEQALAWSFLQQFKNVRASRSRRLAVPGAEPPDLATPSPDAPATKKKKAKNPDMAEKGPAQVPVPADPAAALHGQMLGAPFIPDRVEIQGGSLVIRSGKEFFADQEIKIALRTRRGEPLSGRKFHVGIHDPQKLAIFISHRNPADKGRQTLIARRYDIDIEFGTEADGKLPGKISLNVKDDQGADLTGDFIATVK